MSLTEDYKAIWLWLLTNGGRWTTQELADEMRIEPRACFRRVHNMHRRDLLERFPPEAGGTRLRYGVTGNCLVPLGLRVAEVQA